jgi:Sulfotransferase domain
MPDFLIIGAQKCGTTSLYVYLTQHPQILPATQKELHFFDLNYAQGIDWYLAQFSAKTDEKITLTGESSPYYIFHPCVPQRVHQLFPDTKLIVLLRNPVERTWSHYHHEVRWGFETLDFEAAIDSEAERLNGELEKLRADPNYYSFNHQHYTYLSRGIYVDQLQAWMELFPRNQFLILNSEDFYANPAATLTQTLEFLGLSPWDLGSYPPYNIGECPPISENLRKKLVNHFNPYNQKLFEYLQLHWNWSD